MPVRRSASARSRAGSRRESGIGASNTTKSLPTPCIFVNSTRISLKHSRNVARADPARASCANWRTSVAQCGALPEETPVHDREDSRLYRPRGRALIDDALLQPQRRQLQTNARLDDAR